MKCFLTKKCKICLCIIFGLIILNIISLFCKRECCKPVEIVKTIVITDTVYIKSIVKDTVPKLVYKTSTKDTIFDTIYIKDSIPIIIKLPIENYHYANSIINDKNDTIKYDAFISGYKSKLDSIKIEANYKNITTVITNNIIPPVKWYNRFSIGAQVGVGYGIFYKKPDIYLGLGVNYKLTK